MASEPVERIAAEAEHARTRIASTIDEIQERLDPRRIVGDAVDRLSGSGRQFAAQASDTLRGHPLAIGAAVAAVGVALVARNRLANATVDLGDDVGGYTDYDDGFGLAGVRSPTEDDVASPVPRLPALAARAGNGVAASPLVSIVVGVAAGALLGALFPTSDTERRTLGEVGDRLAKALHGLGDDS